MKKAREAYAREGSSAIWENSYTKEVGVKYKKQNEEYDAELRAREIMLAKSVPEISLSAHPVLNSYEVAPPPFVIANDDMGQIWRVKEKSTGKFYACKVSRLLLVKRQLSLLDF